MTLKQQIEEKVKLFEDKFVRYDGEISLEIKTEKGWESSPKHIKSFLSQALKDIAIDAVKSDAVEQIDYLLNNLVVSSQIGKNIPEARQAFIDQLTAKKAEIIKSLAEI